VHDHSRCVDDLAIAVLDARAIASELRIEAQALRAEAAAIRARCRAEAERAHRLRLRQPLLTWLAIVSRQGGRQPELV
jgi:hypothetical protein